MSSALDILKQFFIQRLILYAAILFFSLFVIVPLGDLRMRFTDGHCSRCLLYSQVSVNNSDLSLTIQEFGAQEVCEYNLAVAAVFSLCYPVCAALLCWGLYRRDLRETRDEKKIDLASVWFAGHCVWDAGLCVLHLVLAATVSRGFTELCEGITNTLGSCADAQDLTTWGPYDGSNFFVSLSVATAGAWLLWVAWLLQSLLALWKLWRLNMLPSLNCFPCVHKDSDL